MPASSPFHRSLAAWALPVLFAACSSLPQEWAEPVPGDGDGGEIVNVLVGLRRMERGSDWAPNDDLGQIGLNYLSGPPDSPWRWDFGLRYAGDQARRSVAGTMESLETRLVDLSVGPLFLLPGFVPGFQPYAGAGTALLWMDSDYRRKGQLLQDQDSTFGVYARSGFWLDFQPNQHIGLDLMWIGAADADFGGEDRRSHSWTLSLVFGYGF